MYTIYSNGRELGIIENPVYILMQDNGYYRLASPEEAQGVNFNGQHYRLAEREVPPSMQDLPEAWLIETDGGERINAVREEAIVPSSIAFVALAQTGTIDDVTAAEHADLFLEWSPIGVHYAVNDIRRDPLDQKLYKVVQAHTSQEGWNPSLQPALWRCIGDPSEEWPEWSQPLGAHDAYSKGDKVTRNGEHYVSDIDANVWPPETYGWHKADE